MASELIESVERARLMLEEAMTECVKRRLSVQTLESIVVARCVLASVISEEERFESRVQRLAESLTRESKLKEKMSMMEEEIRAGYERAAVATKRMIWSAMQAVGKDVRIEMLEKYCIELVGDEEKGRALAFRALHEMVS